MDIWRKGAKGVSYSDMIVQAVAVWKFLCAPADDYDELLANLYFHPVMNGLGPVVFVILLFLACLLLISFEVLKAYAAIQLMQAAELGVNAKEAAELCSIWRIVTILWLIMNLCQSYLNGRFKKTIVFHLIALCIVSQYMKQLNISVLTPNASTPSVDESIRHNPPDYQYPHMYHDRFVRKAG